MKPHNYSRIELSDKLQGYFVRRFLKDGYRFVEYDLEFISFRNVVWC